MRSDYFTNNNIEGKSIQFAGELKESDLLRSLGKIPEKTALLVLDMQDYFLDPSSHAYIPSAKAIVPGINLLIKEFFSRNMLTIITQHIDNDSNSGMMSTWWKNNINKTNPLSEISKQIENTESVLLKKTQYDAFWQSDLEKILKGKEITDILITGVMTHLCCESTARSAFVRGYNVIFTIDGTATYNEDYHRSSLRNLAHGFAYMKTIPEVLESLK